MGRGEADRPGAGHIARRAGAHAGRNTSVVAGGEDAGEHRQVEDLLHRLILGGELEQVPVGVGDHDVLCLAADPAAHVHVAVRAARLGGIDVQAHAGVALLAVATPAAGDVERGRDEIALLDELDTRSDLHDLAGDLVSEDETFGCRRAPAHHVLV